MSRRRRIAVIGAGVAGLACARELARESGPIVVFEKARGPSGRCATRRAGDLRFDHGAQYFTARDPDFLAEVRDWVARGVAAPWAGTLLAQAPDGRREPLPADERFVGTPTMSAIGRDLAGELELELRTRLIGIRRDADRTWLLGEDGARFGPFDAAVVAIPAPQAAPLLSPVPAFAEAAQQVRLAPCWATLASFVRPIATGFDALALEDHPVLAWVACNHAKPGRAAAQSFTLHASARFSETWLERDPDEVGKRMLEAFASLVDAPLPPAAFRAAHRWRHALVTAPLGRPFLWDPAAGLGACGDWCLAPRVEAAWSSGRQLGRAMAGTPS